MSVTTVEVMGRARTRRFVARRSYAPKYKLAVLAEIDAAAKTGARRDHAPGGSVLVVDLGVAQAA